VGIGLVALCGGASAGVNDAPRKVRQGLAEFEAGQFQEAARAFAEAQAARPEDAKILFDLACAKAATGETDAAVELWVKAAVTPDAALAAACHYNLGQLALERAQAALGPKPEEAAPEVRSKALEELQKAITHYRDALAAEPDYEDARHNLELARLWGRKMEETWRDRDRQRRREQMNLGEYLDWLDEQQRGQRSAVPELAAMPKSPVQRLAVHRAKQAQRDLIEEIEPLRAKIAQAISASPEPAGPNSMGAVDPINAANRLAAPGSGVSAMSPEEQKRAIEVLGQLATRAGESMRTAAEHLNEQLFSEARVAQAGAIEELDQVATVVTPYPELVQKSVKKEEGLVGQVTSVVRGPAETLATKPAAADATERVPPDDRAEHRPGITQDDLSETGWEQRFVERWTPIMVGKARQGLKNLPPPSPEAPATDGKTDEKMREKTAEPADPRAKPVTSEASKPADPQAAVAEAARRKQEGLRKSMELAVKLGPKVQELAAQAAGDLDAGRAGDALPKQQEALRLLREIAKPLEQPNQSQKNQDEKQQQNQQKQDQDKKRDQKDKNQQDKKDQAKQDQDKRDQEKKDQDKQGVPQPEPPQPQQQQEKAERQERQREPRDVSKEQAEALMLQIRQRQREKKEMDKAIKLYLSRPQDVEKDW